MHESFSGTMRACVRQLDDGRIQLEWFNAETMEVIWTETVKLPPDRGFVSQIVGDGNYSTIGGHFIDSAGKRHFVLAADPGRLGAMTTRK